MGKTQKMRENGETYTAGKSFTLDRMDIFCQQKGLKISMANLKNSTDVFQTVVLCSNKSFITGTRPDHIRSIKIGGNARFGFGEIFWYLVDIFLPKPCFCKIIL